MSVISSATTRKHMNYNTTRSSQSLKAAYYDVDLRKHCYNAHKHTQLRHGGGETDISVKIKLRLR